MSQCYGLTGNYGEGCYKGDVCTGTVRPNLLIQQYKTPYINSSFEVSIFTPNIPEPNVVTVGNISTLGFIQQFKDVYTNG